ncbi:MAG TPA: hypothetical protein VJN44_02010 [Roseateles sp.]|nr:hypothetical protein [Roseateles sp.]
MYLDLQNPDSIVNWWREFPQRHWAYLDALDRLTPQFRAAIQQARLRIRNDPRFGELLAGAGAAAPLTEDSTPLNDDDNDDARDFAPKYGGAPLMH